LPADAGAGRWWANSWQRGRAYAWLAAGWRVTGHNFRVAHPTVTFTRADSIPEPTA